MSTPKNQAAWLKQANTPLEVGPAPMPTAGPGEIIVKNAAIAINPVDWHQQEAGIFIQQFPAIIGCDVAGEVHEVGEGVERFKKGDRVIGHSTALATSRPVDGAFALYTAVPSTKAALLPSHVPFTHGVVLPFALEAAVCALSVREPGPCMPGVLTPALALPYPSLSPPPTPTKLLIVNGASSSVGSTTTQIATATGISVFGITSAQNFALAKESGASEVFDRRSPSLVEAIVAAVQRASNLEFIGIVDAISTPENYEQDLAILRALGGENTHLACTHPPPTEGVPSFVQTGMIFAVNDIVGPVFRDFVTPALEMGLLKCLPGPTVVGKGLEFINEALRRSKAGVSGTKLVVEV